MSRAVMLAICAATIMIVVKAGVWWLSGSVALLGALFDSLLDLLASAINMAAVRYALVPADREHRFGHGKAEALAGLGQASIVLLSSVAILFEAAQHALDPHPLAFGRAAIGVMVFSTVLTLALVTYQRHVLRRTGSLAIRADSLHYHGDLFMNVAVIVAIVLTAEFGILYADPLFGAGIAVFLGWSAWRILRQSLDQLMDRELGEPERTRIKDVVLAHPDVCGMHDLRARMSGRAHFIQLHMELPPDMSLLEAHRVADEVEASIRKLFHDAEVLIHQDPEGLENITPLESA